MTTPCHRIRIALLGPLTVTVDGVPTAITGRTQRRLITALALAAASGTPASIESLLTAMYDDSSGGATDRRRSLATLVWKLRRQWGAGAIESDRHHYWLSSDRCTVDIREFSAAIAHAHAAEVAGRAIGAARAGGPASPSGADGASGAGGMIDGPVGGAAGRSIHGSAAGTAGQASTDSRRIAVPGRGQASGTGSPTEPTEDSEEHSEAAMALRAALDLWRDAEPDVPEPDRSRLIEWRLGAAERLADLAAAAGDHLEVVRLTAPIVEARPTWEHSQALQIASLTALRDRRAAGRAYAAARRALQDEGVEPGPELARAGEAAANGEAAATSVVADAAAAPTTGAATNTNDDQPAGTLIGRTREANLLVGRILVALDGHHPAVVVVTGEPGIGKSALVAEALVTVREARATRVVTVRCDERNALPYGPLVDLAAMTEVPALTATIGGGDTAAARHADDPTEIHAALLNDLRQLAAPAGLVLVVEDVHWAPTATIDALLAALQRGAGVPIALVATTRSTPGGSRLARVADRMIPLTGLSGAEVRVMTRLESDPARAAAVYRLTGGNPLFVTQLQQIGLDRLPLDGTGRKNSGTGRKNSGASRGGRGGTGSRNDGNSSDGHGSAGNSSGSIHGSIVGNGDGHRGAGSGRRVGDQRGAVGASPIVFPTDLTAAIEAHLAQVPPSTRTALQVAAAVGDRFDLITLSAIAGPLRRGPTEWQGHLSAAIRSGLVRPDGDGGSFRFVHALIAAHLSAELTAAERTTTHAAIAAALRRISLARPTSPDILAHHYTAGWPEVPTEQVVDALLAAAHAVGAQFDFAHAADYYRAALDYLAMDPAAGTDARRAQILGVAAGARAAAGDLKDAARLYGAQERLAADTGLIGPRIFAALGALRLRFLARSAPRVADPLATALAAALESGCPAATGDSTTPDVDGPVAIGDGRVADARTEPSAATPAHDVSSDLDLALIGDALAAVSVYQPGRARELADAVAAHRPAARVPLNLALWEHLTVPDQLTSARRLVAATGAAPERTGGAAAKPRAIQRAIRRATQNATPETTQKATPPATQEARAHRVATWLRLWVAEVAAGLRRFDDPPPREFGLGDADDQTRFDLAQWQITREITAGHLDRARALIAEALAGPRHADPAERARRAASFYGQGLFLALLARQPAAIANSPIVTNPTWVTRHPMMRYIRTSLAVRAAGIGADQTRGSGTARATHLIDELVDELADGDIPDSDLAPRLILTAEACRVQGHLRGLTFCRTALAAHRGEHGIFRFGQYWGSIDQSLGDVLAALGEPEAAAAIYRDALGGLAAVNAAVHLPSAQRGLADALTALGRAGDRGEIEELSRTADEADRTMGLIDRAAR